ncbi:xanthine dehydrogenase accessory protein XdhC [Halobacteriovorax sp. HLS]|uniref:xanthine dehydrogenase accessory protein XdhC n=1 Tax=Halobacteriovorax sp. HLS TaxID=2234000 RepID=UPI000FD9BB1B|nr:xanthine dehydrogenase accessory protein XdhC [Halobacteriovorax sp. HLS]
MIEEILKLQKLNKPFCVATLVNVRGSAPQDQGAKIIILPCGDIQGTIGGGKIEAHAIQYAKDKLSSKEKKKTFFETWNLQRDIGMTCGGEVSIFFELYNLNTWNITVFGAGHVSQKLVRVLNTLSCHITLVDNREEWIDKCQGLENVTTIYLEEMSDHVKSLKEDNFVVIMTMGHSYDMPILREIFTRKLKFPYLGVIGSQSKRNVIEKELLEFNLKDCEFTCPMGLPIGDNSPEEISISVTAELLKYKDSYFKTSKRN